MRAIIHYCSAHLLHEVCFYLNKKCKFKKTGINFIYTQ